MIISLEVEDGSRVFKKFQYLADGFKSGDFGRKVLAISEGSTDSKRLSDWRDFVEITITTFMANKSERFSTSVVENDAIKQDKSMERPTELDSNVTIEQKPYFSGNPVVEVTKGILHLYKINDEVSQNNFTRTNLLCMLSVPAKISCTDLLNFISSFEKHIEHIRVIRDPTPNIYMTLLKFNDLENAHEFYDMFNGKLFNTLEPEVCHLVYVCKVESMKSSDGACLPLEGATELPTCHICLERMDESVEGILTVLCNHSFHSSCLVKWDDSTCPVCRCLQTTEVLQDNKCFCCDSKENLWICLICGHIGCGRYNEGHAHRHFRETEHTYSMELETQRVWDYTGDNYVHRLVQNKSDGKLVEFGAPPGEVPNDEKLDSITLEYTYLLTSQLESQRHYFEEKITFVEKDAFEQMEAVVEKSQKTLEECQKYERMFSDSEKERKILEKKNSQCTTKLKKMEKELEEEKQMNECLRKNQQLWQKKVAELEKQLKRVETQRKVEVAELQDQVGDLLRHFEAQTAIEKAPADLQQEIQEGQMFVNQNQARGSHKPRKKHK